MVDERVIGGIGGDSYPDSVEVAVAGSDPDVFWKPGHVGERI